MPVLPLGLACVAGATRAAGHDVKVINLMGRGDTGTMLQEAIVDFSPEVIGISVRNIDDQCMSKPRFLLEPVKKVVTECRRLSDAPIVLGGAGYSIFPKSSLAYLGADMGIQGEGEQAFVTLLERLRKKATLSDIHGLYLSGDGLQAEPSFAFNMDSFPLPAPDGQLWSFPEPGDQELWVPFQTRRGCPLRCNYCSTSTIEGRILRKHSQESVVKALSQYVEAGFDKFFFVDNTFNFPPSYAKSLCDLLVAAGLNISWRCILYPRNVDEDLVAKMARAGCKEVSLGFESGSSKILRIMGKNFQPQEIKHVAESLRKYGIRRAGFLLLGGPGESEETVEESLAFADSLELEFLKITLGVRIYPHTELARTAVREGLITPDDDLFLPKFYMSHGLEDWLRTTVKSWSEKHPNWAAS